MVHLPLLGGSLGCAPSPLWLSYEDAFSAEDCTQLIAMVDDGPAKDAGLVDGKAERSIRKTAIHWLNETDDSSWVFQRLTALIARANRDIFHFALSGFDEDAQIGRYCDGGFYDWHIDRGGRGLGRSRKLTVAVQLSPADAYTGGALELNPDGREVQAPREQGTAVIFPAYMLHRVTPVTSGARHSLVIWMHGPDFA